MRKICFKGILFASLGLFLMGCVGQKPVVQQPMQPFQPVDLNAAVTGGTVQAENERLHGDPGQVGLHG